MGELRSSPATRDSTPVSSALERELDLNPFTLSRDVHLALLSGLYQDVAGSTNPTTLAAAAVLDQMGRPSLCTRAVTRKVGDVKIFAQTATIFGGTGGKSIKYFVPAGKGFRFKALSAIIGGTCTYDAVNFRFAQDQTTSGAYIDFGHLTGASLPAANTRFGLNAADSAAYHDMEFQGVKVGSALSGASLEVHVNVTADTNGTLNCMFAGELFDL